jgi:hypothetical protein
LTRADKNSNILVLLSCGALLRTEESKSYLQVFAKELYVLKYISTFQKPNKILENSSTKSLGSRKNTSNPFSVAVSSWISVSNTSYSIVQHSRLSYEITKALVPIRISYKSRLTPLPLMSGFTKALVPLDMSISTNAHSALAFQPVVQNSLPKAPFISNVLPLNAEEGASSNFLTVPAGYIKAHLLKGTVVTVERGYTSKTPPANRSS